LITTSLIVKCTTKETKDQPLSIETALGVISSVFRADSCQSCES
jgi:hypothetical protein